MSDREEWGPWVQHDGKGCPCVGMFVHMVYDRLCRFSDGFEGYERQGLVLRDNRSWWHNTGPQFGKIVSYRIRKPRALIQLREMIETLPAPSRQKEDTHV